MAAFSGNLPNPPLSKGGEGGFLKFVAKLRRKPFLRSQIRREPIQIHQRIRFATDYRGEADSGER